MTSTNMFPNVVLADVNDARIFRQQLCQWIETASALLDAMEGDTDFEVEVGVDQDFNPITLDPEHRMPVKRITMRKFE
jgi:hypothetical protein